MTAALTKGVAVGATGFWS